MVLLSIIRYLPTLLHSMKYFSRESTISNNEFYLCNDLREHYYLRDECTLQIASIIKNKQRILNTIIKFFKFMLLAIEYFDHLCMEAV